MRKGLSICDWTVQVAAMSFLIIWILLANGSLAIAREEHDTTSKPAEPCAEDNGGLTLPPISAQPCSQITLAMRGTSSSLQMVWCTSIPGVAAITPTIPLPQADS